MRILGVDTSTKFLCLGILDNHKIYEYNLDVGRRHSEELAPTVKGILEALHWQLNEIDYFACGLGPGSFTGIRVGLATLKAWSWSLKRPMVGISTLDILAQAVTETPGYIVPSLDAKRGLIYCSIYQAQGHNLKRLSPYLLLNQEEFFRRVPKNASILGDALTLYKEKLLENIKGASLLDSSYWYPKASNLMVLAQGKIRNKEVNDAFSIKPIYLYPKECQVKNPNIKYQNPKF